MNKILNQQKTTLRILSDNEAVSIYHKDVQNVDTKLKDHIGSLFKKKYQAHEEESQDLSDPLKQII